MPHRAIPRLNRTRAKTLRQSMTDAEQRLWYRLRAHRLSGASFRRQFPIGRYIVDFVCLETQLVVEGDGPVHDEQVEQDHYRSEVIESYGFRVLRVGNDEVINDLSTVLARIEAASGPDRSPLSRARERVRAKRAGEGILPIGHPPRGTDTKRGTND